MNVLTLLWKTETNLSKSLLYIRGWLTIAHWPNPTHHPVLSIKFYWNTVTLTCLHVVSDCFFTTTAELSSSNRDHRAHKAWNIYYLAIYKKCLLTPGLYDVQTTSKWIHSFSQPAVTSIHQQPMWRSFPTHSTWLTPALNPLTVFCVLSHHWCFAVWKQFWLIKILEYIFKPSWTASLGIHCTTFRKEN